MTASLQYSEFGYPDAHGSHMHHHILPHLMTLASPLIPGMRVLDLGCGNGALCGEFLKLGCQVVGIDLSLEGIALARKSYPEGRFELMEANESILERLQEPPFDLVVSTEVVEHVYAPRTWAKGAFNAIKPGGRLICSTPYHGYLKNLLISILGKWDTHADPLWDGGHIKLWSRKSLSSLLVETGFSIRGFRGAGRLPYLWMTMILLAQKPHEAT